MVTNKIIDIAKFLKFPCQKFNTNKRSNTCFMAEYLNLITLPQMAIKRSKTWLKRMQKEKS